MEIDKVKSRQNELSKKYYHQKKDLAQNEYKLILEKFKGYVLIDRLNVQRQKASKFLD